MRLVLEYAGDAKKYVYSALVIILIGVAIGIVPYLALNELLKDILIENSLTVNIIIKTALIAGIALILKAVIVSWGLAVSHKGAYQALYNIRKVYAYKVTEQRLGDIFKDGSGKYKKGFVEDINMLESLLAHFLPEGISHIAVILLVVFVIASTNLWLGFISMVSIIIGLIPMFIMMSEIMDKAEAFQESQANMNDTIIEYVEGMEVVKVFNQTSNSYKRFTDSISKYKEDAYKNYDCSWEHMGFVWAILPVNFILTLPIGLYFYLSGSITLPALLLVLMLNYGISSNLTKLINFIAVIPSVDMAMKNLEELFIKTDVICENRVDKPENFDITFDDVTFAYEETEVLKHISFTAKQNTITALVGESGSGKSTIAKLIVHYWDVNSGSIVLGGNDIREYSMGTLMPLISYVSQDNMLFSGTILDNIAMGNMDATREEIIEYAKRASCHDFIMQLENGYDSEVGSLGGKLSGGEKQRITIARAMLKNAPIVILDEATAFSDAENEDLIKESLSHLLMDKTVFIIAHKLNTIIEADNIILLKNGEIEAQGTHETLISNSDAYQKLWEKSEKSTSWELSNQGGVANV